jgi:hypothetical protein
MPTFWRSALLIGIGGAIAAGAGLATHRDPGSLVGALIENAPSSLGELEAIIGDLHRDPAKWEDAIGPLRRGALGRGVARAEVELDIDLFHQRPDTVKDPRLSSWSLDFAVGRQSCRRLLRARFPHPSELTDAGRRVLRCGDFYLSELDVADGFRLSWYRRQPAFAIPERDASATAKLVEALAAVAHEGFSRASIVARLGPLAYDSGLGVEVLRQATWIVKYAPAGAAQPDSFRIELERPLPGRDLLPRLGIERPVVAAADVHMQSRRILDLAHPTPAETGYALPAAGGYAVDVRVDPQGLVRVPGHEAGSPLWSAEGAQIIALQAFPPRGRGRR